MNLLDPGHAKVSVETMTFPHPYLMVDDFMTQPFSNAHGTFTSTLHDVDKVQPRFCNVCTQGNTSVPH